MEDKTQTHATVSNKKLTFVIIVAVIFAAAGAVMLALGLKYYFSFSDIPQSTYTKVVYKTVSEEITMIEKEQPEEVKNYEQPVDFPPIKLLDVPYINQTKKYPTGCESVSTVMALNFAGYSITPEEFIDGFLPKSTAPYIDSTGNSLGYNPSKTFLGDPYSKSGWGCYFPVIRKCLYAVTDNRRHTVETLHKTPLKDLCGYIDNEIPVIIWATQGMNKPKKSQTWKLLDGEGNFTWVSPNHCMLLVGYDDTGYYFNDPLTHKNCRYPADIAEKRYNSMGKQALAIVPFPLDESEEFVDSGATSEIAESTEQNQSDDAPYRQEDFSEQPSNTENQ